MLAGKYQAQAVEKHWQTFWDAQQVYRFDPEAEGEIFSIDTPPPTVSGRLHIGHIFSYTQAEMVARYQRLQGFRVFYPLGFDDNGLPTERLVEQEHGIQAAAVSSSEFRSLCWTTKAKYEKEFRDLFQSMGFSVDWSLTYETVSPRVQRLAQFSFLELVRQGKAYQKETPVLWCPRCSTSIAQAELESVEQDSVFYWIPFTIGSTAVTIATTRPELLYGCAALFAHPDDARYRRFVGQQAEVPLFGHQVPVLTDARVDVDKGSGIVMCCTFGDSVDLEWYQEYDLPYRSVILPDGTIDNQVPISGGMNITEARRAVVAALQERGPLQQRQDIQHHVAVHERCGTAVEIIPSRQWYIDVLSHKQRFLEAADEIRWYPSYMKERYRIWVENLRWDWCISRQRYFGVPFPLWYCAECGEPLLADIAQLPVCPEDHSPDGPCTCGSRHFVPETAVMDTWATSSLTPLINARWQEPGDRSEQLLPMSMRTQAHEIIRTWAFYTIVKQLYHTGTIPWRDIMICGFVLAKRGEKLSKSKSNAAAAPQELVAAYGADALRYWAANSKLGTDSTFSIEELQVSQRFLTKLWNAAKFTLMHLADYEAQASQEKRVLAPVDRWLLQRWAETKRQATAMLDRYEVGAARQELDQFFWHSLCDDYLEIAKDRLYNPDVRGQQLRQSAQQALYHVFLELLQLYGIFVPHITEEIYQAYFRQREDCLSLHQMVLDPAEERDELLLQFGQTLSDIVSQVRKYKSQRKLSLKEPLDSLAIWASAGVLQLLQAAEGDLLACTKAKRMQFTEGEWLQVEIHP